MKLPWNLRFPLDYNAFVNYDWHYQEGWWEPPPLTETHYNLGISFGTPFRTPVYAMSDADYCGLRTQDPRVGNLLWINHVVSDHPPLKFHSWYGRLDEIVVKEGQSVKKGELLGYTAGDGKDPLRDGHYYANPNLRVPHLLWGFSRFWPSSIPRYPYPEYNSIAYYDVGIPLPMYGGFDKDGNLTPAPKDFPAPPVTP